MKKWNERTKEVAYLLNPAFCGRILYVAIREYENKTNRAIPFPLIYLILPLVLHKATRDKVDSRTKLWRWTQEHPQLLIDFSYRAKDLISITNEALELLLQSNMVHLNLNGELEYSKIEKAFSKTKYTDEEIIDCLKKSEHIARWFAAAGKTENIYVCLGVRP